MAQRQLHGLQRVLGVNALFSTAYGNVGSSIYYALGLVAAFALGLTPLVYIIAGLIFVMTAMTYAEAATNFPEAGELFGVSAVRRFFEDQRKFMGPGRVEILEEHDLGERCLMRIRQNVEAPASGVRSSYDWSLLSTAPAGKIIRIEFFIDREQALKAAGVRRADS